MTINEIFRLIDALPTQGPDRETDQYERYISQCFEIGVAFQSLQDELLKQHPEAGADQLVEALYPMILSFPSTQATVQQRIQKLNFLNETMMSEYADARTQIINKNPGKSEAEITVLTNNRRTDTLLLQSCTNHFLGCIDYTEEQMIADIRVDHFLKVADIVIGNPWRLGGLAVDTQVSLLQNICRIDIARGQQVLLRLYQTAPNDAQNLLKNLCRSASEPVGFLNKLIHLFGGDGLNSDQHSVLSAIHNVDQDFFKNNETDINNGGKVPKFILNLRSSSVIGTVSFSLSDSVIIQRLSSSPGGHSVSPTQSRTPSNYGSIEHEASQQRMKTTPTERQEANDVEDKSGIGSPHL